MPDTSLVINFGVRSTSSSNFLLIEQEPWGKDVGKTSALQVIAAIQSTLYGSTGPLLNCGGAEGIFYTKIYVYTEPSTLNYKFHLSNGFKMSEVVETVIREEIVQCSMSFSQNTDYPVQSIIRKDWIGDCYSPGGAYTIPPVATISGNKVTFSKKVYGSLRLRYWVKRHVYKVKITKRQTAIENKYQCLAFCVYDGGVKWCDVEAPAGFEETDGACDNGWLTDPDNPLGSVDHCPPKYEVPYGAYADRYIKIDYCTQEVISDNTSEGVEGTKEVDPGCD